MFNPRPQIVSLPIDDHHRCYVIDDALRQPERLVELARTHRPKFGRASNNAYPGIELRMPEEFSARLDDFFRLHVRARLGARRTLSMHTRLAMVTTPPHALLPRQSICHRDRLDAAADQRVAASVLYLFRDEQLGGTGFFAPRRPQAEMERLAIDSGVLNAPAFAQKYGIEPGYMTAGNDYFQELLTVPARWNRMIFYDGSVYHSGRITHPERLTDDPASGRLTLNGFFTCSRNAVAQAG
jgi:hypothetical protein